MHILISHIPFPPVKLCVYVTLPMYMCVCVWVKDGEGIGKWNRTMNTLGVQKKVSASVCMCVCNKVKGKKLLN